VLEKYKYQPFIEKRHEQLKSVFEVAPVYLKLPHRIEALMFVYFVVLLLNALIERELRRAMKAEDREKLPLYPEERLCRNPTTERVLTLFRSYRKHVLKQDNKEVKLFHDPLPDLQRTILRLIRVPETDYTGHSPSL
jgi:transposase